jgi:hypothetical protein
VGRQGLQRKSFFAAAAKKIGAVELEERSTPWFLARERQKGAHLFLNLLTVAIAVVKFRIS